MSVDTGPATAVLAPHGGGAAGGPPPTPRRIGGPERVRPRDFHPSDLWLLGATVLSSLALVWVVFYQFTLFSGAFGFVVSWYLCFLALYWFVSVETVDRRTASDRVVRVVMVSAALLVFSLVVYIVGWVVWKGVSHLHLNLLYKDERNLEPANPNVLSQIGVAHAIVGTLEQVALAALIAVPVAVATAIFLNEVKGRGVRAVRTVVTAMSGLPSVVAGIFIYALVVEPGLLNYSGILASVALFILILPLVTRTTEEVLRLVPSGLREASLSLGASEARTVFSVVLPTARSGIITASLLGVAVAVGETAPLLFTAFGSNVMNADPFHGAQGALSLVIYQNAKAAQKSLVDLAYATALILLVIVLVLFVAARIFGRPRTRQGWLRRRLHHVTTPKGSGGPPAYGPETMPPPEQIPVNPVWTMEVPER